VNPDFKGAQTGQTGRSQEEQKRRGLLEREDGLNRAGHKGMSSGEGRETRVTKRTGCTQWIGDD